MCADKARFGSRLADIGTDHGYLPIRLVQTGRIPSAVACDIAEGPLNSARENIERYGLEDRISTRLADGLEGLCREDADDIVIAGMGGELIASILSKSDFIKDPSVLLILQPMTRYEKLSAFLCENGYEFLSQDAVSEVSKTYTVITARYSGSSVKKDLFSCIVGMLDKDKPEDRKFLENALKRLRKQAHGDRESAAAAKRLEEYLL